MITSMLSTSGLSQNECTMPEVESKDQRGANLRDNVAPLWKLFVKESDTKLNGKIFK